MKVHENKKGASLSFLQRFQGKKSAISKQGLLHLFQHHQKKVLNGPISSSSQIRKMNFDNSSKELLTERVREMQRSGSGALRQQKQPASRLSYRTQALKRQPTPKEDFILPRIVNRFSSSYNKLVNNPNHPKMDGDNTKKFYLNLQKPPRKILDSNKKHMDQNALQHLEFLNRLEEKLAGVKSRTQRKGV